MDKLLLESIFGEKSSDISEVQQKLLFEGIEKRATQIAVEKVDAVERKYAEQFSLMTESVSEKLVDMADSAFKNATEKAVKDESITYLMENVNKIRSILEDIGVVVSDDETLKNRMAVAEERHAKGISLLKKAKDIVDKNKDSINKLKVENYIRKSLTGMNQEIVDSALENFADVDIDEIEDILSSWIESGEFNMSMAPRETTLDDDGIDEDELNNDLEELDNMVKSGGLFESEGNRVSMKKTTDRKLDSLRGLKSMISSTGHMSDISGAQLEAIDNSSDSEYDNNDDSQVLSTDVDDALRQISNFEKFGRL